MISLDKKATTNENVTTTTGVTTTATTGVTTTATTGVTTTATTATTTPVTTTGVTSNATAAPTKATTGATGTTVNKTTGTSTGYTHYKTQKYTPQQLKGIKGWLFPNDRYAPSVLATQIMSYRRQYRSEGIKLFVKEWFEPKLHEIITGLESNGYTVAIKLVGSKSNDGDMDGYLNYLIDVSKDDKLGNVLYVAHYDTVDRDTGYTETRYGHGTPTTYTQNQATKKKVSIREGVAFINELLPENKSVACLGADDGAGLAVMLNLLATGTIGGYCFTTGEEVGGVGASDVLDQAESFLKQYSYSIEIDRRGETDMVYEQSVGECASKDFAQWLCDSLNMGHKPSDKGSYTDVATFAEVIPENINIASGYINAHSADEQVSLPYLDNLAKALKGLDWSKAKVTRKAGDFNLPVYTRSRYSGSRYYGYDYGYNDDFDYGYGWAKQAKTAVRDTTATDLDEPVPDLLAWVFGVDPDFMAHCLREGGIECLYDVDTACYGYYGISFEDVVKQYGLENVKVE